MPTYEYRCAKCGDDLEVYQIVLRDAAHQAQGLRRQALQGALARGHRAEGLRLLQDRQPLLEQRLDLEEELVQREQLVVRVFVIELVVRLRQIRFGPVRLGQVRLRKLGLELIRLGQVVEGRSQVGLSPRASRFRRVQAEIGIFGGSGFYSFLDDVRDRRDRHAVRCAQRSRHGRSRRRPAGCVHAPARPRSRVRPGPRSGPGQPVGDAHAGRARGRSVRPRRVHCRPSVHPGDFVVLDQLVDRTWGRADTFYDAGAAHHVSYADPYCDDVSRLVVAAGRRAGVTMHERGTVVVIPGPRFSTRAESRSYRAQGWEVVNMTQYPEAYLARELGMHYAGIALITDYDTGIIDDPNVEPVTQAQVFAFFEENVHRVRALLFELIPTLPRAERVGSRVRAQRQSARSTRTRGASTTSESRSVPGSPVRAGDDRRARGLLQARTYRACKPASSLGNLGVLCQRVRVGNHSHSLPPSNICR